MIAKSLVIYVGGVGAEVREKMEKLTIEERGDIPGFVGSISVDSDPATSPDILLNRQLGEDLVRNPEGYGIDRIPAEITIERLKRTGKGALLNRKLGRLLAIANGENVLNGVRAKVQVLDEEAEKEKEKGLNILDSLQILVVGSPFTGTASALMPELPSILKLLRCKVILVTSFIFTLAGSGLSASQHGSAKDNAKGVLGELIAIQERKTPDTYFPHLSEDNSSESGLMLKYPTFEVPAVLPDWMFTLQTEDNTINEITDGLAIFVKDLVLNGSPLNLKGIENTITNVDGGKVISVSLRNYEFSREKVKNVITERNFRMQLEQSIKREKRSFGILAEPELLKMYGGEER